mmetsp:Transcript_20814/g.39676  ORF Transcript_20814/g.39676 Transcript_20814/m.39676 type:complete len:325 (+) Transcript_20814:76-1050(+)
MWGISSILVSTFLACTSHGRRLQALAEVNQQNLAQPVKAQGLDALAALLLPEKPSAGFFVPAHSRRAGLTNPTLDKMNSKARVAPVSMAPREPKTLMSAVVGTPSIEKSEQEEELQGGAVGTISRVPAPLGNAEVTILDQGRCLALKLVRVLQAIVSALFTRKAVMATAIGIGADLCAQLIAGARVLDDWIPRQTLSMAIWSWTYTGTARPYVDRGFDLICGKGTSTREVLFKQFVELFLFKPFCHVPALYMATGMMAGKGFLGSWHKLCSVYGQTMVFSWALWPVPLYVYFRYIPYKHRVLFYSIFAFIQKCGFSYLSLPGKR